MLSGLSSTPNLTSEQLLERFRTGSARQRRSLIATVEKRSDELAALGPKALSGFSPEGDDWAAGWILQVFQRHQPQVLPALLGRSSGWFTTASAVGIDYSPLQRDLLTEQFEDADRFTSKVLRQLAGEHLTSDPERVAVEGVVERLGREDRPVLRLAVFLADRRVLAGLSQELPDELILLRTRVRTKHA